MMQWRSATRNPFDRLRIERRIFHEGAWVVAGQLLSAVAALVSVRIMTEILVPEQFGRLALLLGVGTLALGLVVTPTLQAVMRFYADWSRDGELATLRVVSVGMVGRLVALAALILAIAGAAAGPWFGETRIIGCLIAVLLITDSIRAFETVLLNSARRQRPTAILYAADAWARPLAAVLAVLLLGALAQWALIGYVAGSAVVLVAMRLFIRLEGVQPGAAGGVHAESGGRLRAAIRRYALPLAPLAIFGWISGVGDRYVIGSMLGLEEVGLYAAAYGLVSRPFLMLAGIVELTMRPILHDSLASGGRAHTERIQVTWIMLVLAGAALGTLLFFMLTDLVAGLLLAKPYHSAAQIIPWIALGHGLHVISDVFSRFCYAYGDTRAVFLLTMVGSMVGLVVMTSMLAFLGLIGVAIAVPIYFGLEFILAVLLCRRAAKKFYGIGTQAGPARV